MLPSALPSHETDASHTHTLEIVSLPHSLTMSILSLSALTTTRLFLSLSFLLSLSLSFGGTQLKQVIDFDL